MRLLLLRGRYFKRIAYICTVQIIFNPHAILNPRSNLPTDVTQGCGSSITKKRILSGGIGSGTQNNAPHLRKYLIFYFCFIYKIWRKNYLWRFSVNFFIKIKEQFKFFYNWLRMRIHVPNMHPDPCSECRMHPDSGSEYASGSNKHDHNLTEKTMNFRHKRPQSTFTPVPSAM